MILPKIKKLGQSNYFLPHHSLFIVRRVNSKGCYFIDRKQINYILMPTHTPIEKKILLLSCSGGAGHIRAAEALLAAYQKQYPHYTVRHINIAEHSGIILNTVLVYSYHFIIKHRPKIFKKVFYYAETDRGHKALNTLIPLLKLSAKKCIKLIKEFNPDRIICTHFVAPFLFTPTPHCYPIDTVVTDYYAHRSWIAPNIRHLFVASEEMKKTLSNKHSSIIVSGIPIHPRFLEQKNKFDLYKKLKINPHHPTLLILSGGIGLIDISTAVEYILKECSELNIVAISGKDNETLYQKLSNLDKRKNDYFVFKYLDNIDEWMRIADIVITKPGGLTVTECLHLKKPLLLLNPIPGQEEKNAEYIIKYNFGRLIKTPNELVGSIKLLIENPHFFRTPTLLLDPNEIIINQP